MFVMYFYSYIIAYGNEIERDLAKRCIERCFEILNEKQNKETGYWGNYPDKKHGCFGAAHLYLFYDYFKKEIAHKEKIIDSTLTFHSGNGLCINEEGGGCEDYNLLEIYLRVSTQTDYRKNEVLEKAYLMRNEIVAAQNNDGGFSYKFYKPMNIFERIVNSKRKQAVYRYSSWGKMETAVYSSDLWASYFRTLSLAAADQLIDGKTQLNSYHLPGWGYLHEQPTL